MQRLYTKLRCLAVHSTLTRRSFPATRCLLHNSSPAIHFISTRWSFNSLNNNAASPSFAVNSISPLALSLVQARHVSSRERAKRRKPMTPRSSKIKKIKMKSYSSFKSRFRTMSDGNIRRWREGKNHNAHLKSHPCTFTASCVHLDVEQSFEASVEGTQRQIFMAPARQESKKSRRRLRQPAIVPAAYAKVMKKLNFCG